MVDGGDDDVLGALELRARPQPTLVGVPRRPIQTPSACANLSLASERTVIQRTPGVTSRPAGPLRGVELLQERPGAVELAARQRRPCRPRRHGSARRRAPHARPWRRRRWRRSCGSRSRRASCRSARPGARRLRPAPGRPRPRGRPDAPRVEVRPSCALSSTSRASGYGRSIACRRLRGQPFDSKRQSVVIQSPAVSPLPCTNTIGGRSAVGEQVGAGAGKRRCEDGSRSAACGG